MRIAFLLPFLEIYGAIRVMVGFSNELVSRGYEVTIFHSDGSRCKWLETKAEVKPKAVFLEEEFDVVIANLRRVVDLLHSCKSKLKFYLVSDKWSEFDASYQNMLNSDWAKLAPTQACQDWLTKKGIASYYFPPGFDEKIFYPIERCESKEANSVSLLWSGDGRIGKGKRVIKKMSEILKERGVNFTLNIYYNKGKNQFQIAKIYQHTDIFIESVFGDAALRSNPVLEAMACGAPVLCTLHESVEEWVVHMKTAYVVSRRDPDLLADAVITLKNDPALRQKLREGALKKVSEFTWVRAGDIFEAIVATEMRRCEE